MGWRRGCGWRQKRVEGQCDSPLIAVESPDTMDQQPAVLDNAHLLTGHDDLDRLLAEHEYGQYWRAVLTLLRESTASRAASLHFLGQSKDGDDGVFQAGDWPSAALAAEVASYERTAHAGVAADEAERLVVRPAAGDRAIVHALVTVDGEVRGSVSLVMAEGVTVDDQARLRISGQVQALVGNGLRAQDLRQTRDALERTQLLHQITQAVTTSLDLTTVLNLATQIAADALDAEAATLFRVDQEADELVFMITKGTAATLLEEQRMPMDQGVAGWVATHGQHLIVNATHDSRLFDSSIDSKTGFSTRNILCVPLDIQRRIIGVLEVLNKRHGRQFTSADADWLGAMAQQIAIALDNAQLYAREQRKVRELATLNRLSHVVSRNLDVKAVLDAVTQGLLDITAADRSELLLLDDSRQALVLRASAGYGASNDTGSAPPSRRVPLEAGIEGWVLAHGQPASVRRADGDEDFVVHPGLPELGQASVAAAPLNQRGAAVGVVLVYSLAGQVFDQERLNLLQTFANQAATALQNAELYQALRTEQERILRAQEEVRHQLARQLHDQTAQMLSLIILNLDLTRRMLAKARTADVGRALDEIEQVARQANQQVRALLFELRPTILESRGLVPALEAYHQQLLNSMDAEVQLVVEPPDFALELQGARVIFGIIQEAINNVRRHAGARRVWIRLHRRTDQLIFEVEDDGVGFDVTTTLSQYPERGSYGLFNMREQADLLGGTLSLLSPGPSGRGVLVRGTIPISRLLRAD